MKVVFALFFLCSGWIVAGITFVHLNKQIELRDAIHQDSINMQQISFFLWDYAQNNNGALPDSLRQGLSHYGAEEPMAFMYDFMTPKAQLFSLPANTPILKTKRYANPGYEMVMYASGQTIQRPLKAEQGDAANP